jgi:simple sugar transport system substrate-binding protein
MLDHKHVLSYGNRNNMSAIKTFILKIKNKINIFHIVFVLFILLTLFICLRKPSKHFEGIKIFFFGGGAPDMPFCAIVSSGARAAERDLGCTVKYVWSNWDRTKMAIQFKEVIEKKPDGICIMGHSGEEVLQPLIEEAFSKGIVVTSLNVQLPKIENTHIDKGFGYVGEAHYNAGFFLGNTTLKKYDFSKGDRALVWGLIETEQDHRGLRGQGVIDALEKSGIIVDYIEITPEIQQDTRKGLNVIKEYIHSNQNVKLIVIDHGGLTAKFGYFLKELGIKPGEIIGAGFDITAGSVSGIKEGYIGIVADQQSYLQGYFPILQICLAKKYGFSGLHIDTSSSFVTSYNVEQVETLAKKKIR